MNEETSPEVVLLRDTHRVTMADVDAAGVIFYVSPYLWRESLFTRWLHESGRPLSSLLAAGTPPPCVSSSASYLAPVRLDDAVGLTLSVERVGRSSFDLRMDATVGEQLAVVVRTTNVWTTRDGTGLRPTPLPSWLLELFGARAAAQRPS